MEELCNFSLRHLLSSIRLLFVFSRIIDLERSSSYLLLKKLIESSILSIFLDLKFKMIKGFNFLRLD